ncbi:MAG TPA: carbamoyl-phosphate synthase domain-containing protein, partial [Verrucomicrobiae bacterium]|nr:carbamoyl-phosphate synthase domain-containing protein [Verrucomicrobiae bacterium]
MNSAILALEDGTVFEGRSFGAPRQRSGEVVF